MWYNRSRKIEIFTCVRMIININNKYIYNISSETEEEKTLLSTWGIKEPNGKIKEESILNFIKFFKEEFHVSINSSEEVKNRFSYLISNYENELNNINSVLSSYEEKYNFTYFPHQKENIEKFSLLSSGILSDDMGLGKGLSLLSMIKPNHRTIILANVAGKEVLRSEGKRFLPHLNIQFPKEFCIPKEDNEVNIFTYNSLPALSKECKNEIPMEEYFKDINENTFLISDEYHNVKNFKANRSKRFRALSKQILKKSGKVIGSTGTVIVNNQLELWCLLSHLNLTSSTYGNYDNFQKVMGGKLQRTWNGKFFTVWDPMEIKEYAPRLIDHYIIKHNKEEVLENLPDKIRSYIRIPMTTDKDKNLYTELNKKLKNGLSSFKEFLGKEKKQESVFKIKERLSKDKTTYALKLIEDILEENPDEKLIVFSAFLSSAEAIAKKMNWELITGKMNAIERKKIQDKFQAGEIQGISATIQAGGTALQLTQANKMIFIDREWSNINLQAEDRIRRIGQKKVCNYYYIISDHELEDNITNLLHRKEEISSRSISSSANKKSRNTLELLKDILSWN